MAYQSGRLPYKVLDEIITVHLKVDSLDEDSIEEESIEHEESNDLVDDSLNDPPLLMFESQPGGPGFNLLKRLLLTKDVL